MRSPREHKEVLEEVGGTRAGVSIFFLHPSQVSFKWWAKLEGCPGLHMAPSFKLLEAAAGYTSLMDQLSPCRASDWGRLLFEVGTVYAQSGQDRTIDFCI